MTFLPIVDRELRVASRQGWTYWGRTWVALGSMVIIGWLMVTMSPGGGSAALAQTLFATLASLCFGFTLLTGVFFSADSLARERREGTLGLLFLTDLRSLDISLGKLAATSLSSIYCLVAVLPVLAIPLILGGITAQEYLRMVAVLLATLWLALTSGLLASTLTERAGSAAGVAALLLSVICLGPPLLALGLSNMTAVRHLDDSVIKLIYWATPFAAFGAVFDSTPNFRALGYYYSLSYALIVGCLGLLWATCRLPNLWQDAATHRPSQAVASAEASRRSLPANELRTRQLALGAIVWLSNRSQWNRRFPWILLGTCTVFWLSLRWLVGADWNGVPGWIATSLVVHTCFKMWLAGEAPRVFHDERRSGGIELLLTTGLSTAELVGGRIKAIRQLYIGPLLVVSAIDLVMFLGNTADVSGSPEDRILIPGFWFGRIAMLWLDAEALVRTGIWISVSTLGRRTTGPTWLRVVSMPYALWLFGGMVIGLCEVLGVSPLRNISEMTHHVEFLIMGLVLGVNFAVSGFWWVRAELGLKRGFRALAGRPLGKRAPG